MYPLTPYPLTPIGSFFGLVLSVIPLASHVGFQSWNTGIFVYAFWIGTMNFINFVNTIVWHDNVNPYIQVWCDITTKIQIGALIGVPACTLVLCIHLFKITRMRGVAIVDEKAQRRRTLIIDLSLTLGFPVLIMALSIIVQTYRFNIIEEIGCQAANYSYVTYVIIYVPQFFLNLIAVALAPFTLQKFIRHRSEMNEVISSQTNATPNKYIRVMVVTCLNLLFDLPVLVIIVVTHAVQGHTETMNFPFYSWEFIHDTLNMIVETDASMWGAPGRGWQVFENKWNEWIYVLQAIVFFCVFGTTPEARRRYRCALSWVLEKTRLKKKAPSKEESDMVFNSNPARPNPVR
ncbi:fungal pheromone STE3G-protein-coupled receptor [Schizopora paradoxa]|uniref:Fungal pheromone STE3G-protein-coupled receptor n=1 Tax=Schizopora paradoxa TaxID=27342 RepID=A0A0H2RXD1_9AGAM|nr:fungal pheromone STE3G-protein-coupled receptor [Schizopora paradoxa]